MAIRILAILFNHILQLMTILVLLGVSFALFASLRNSFHWRHSVYYAVAAVSITVTIMRKPHWFGGYLAYWQRYRTCRRN